MLVINRLGLEKARKHSSYLKQVYNRLAIRSKRNLELWNTEEGNLMEPRPNQRTAYN